VLLKTAAQPGGKRGWKTGDHHIVDHGLDIVRHTVGDSAYPALAVSGTAACDVHRRCGKDFLLRSNDQLHPCGAWIPVPWATYGARVHPVQDTVPGRHAAMERDMDVTATHHVHPSLLDVSTE